jgi:hypothetical protein
MTGLVACFRNEAIFGQEVAGISSAKAFVKYFDSRGLEIGDGFPGVMWLGEYLDVCDLKPGGKSGCVLFLIGGARPQGGLAHARVCSKVRRSSSGSEEIVDEDREFIELPSSVEITILDSKGALVLPPLKLAIDEKTLTLRSM